MDYYAQFKVVIKTTETRQEEPMFLNGNRIKEVVRMIRNERFPLAKIVNRENGEVVFLSSYDKIIIDKM